MEPRRRKVVYLGTPLLIAAVLITILVITASSSGPATSGGFYLPIACNGPEACISVARQAGFQGHVLTPSGGVVNYGHDFYTPQQGHLGLAIVLGYRDLQSGQAFKETIGIRPLSFVYPCPSLPGDRLATSSQGRTVCLGVADSSTNTLGIRFYSSGTYYELAPVSGVRHSAQEAFLLRLVDNLGWMHSERADPGPSKWST